MMRVLAICAFMTACVADSPDPQHGNSTCAPTTCEAVGASCGMIPDGCNGTLDCGACSGTDHDNCIASTCIGLGAQCGAIDNGCGVMLDCSSCASDQVCNSNRCIATACGGSTKNVCGGCPALPVQPGAACACGGNASCTSWGGVSCGQVTQTLPNTDDADDAWKQVTGGLPGYFKSGQNDPAFQAPIETYNVYVDDTWYGVLGPEFQLTLSAPAPYPLKVCAADSIYDATFTCSSGGDSTGSHQCCQILAAGQTTLSFDATINGGWPSPLDQNLHVAMTVRAAPTGASGPASACMSYTLKYRF